MNMQKMLNVFILLFVLINGLLFAFNHFSDQDRYTISSERQALLDRVLEERGVILYEYLPEYYPMPRLIVSAPEDEDDDQLVKQIFFGEDRTLSKSTESTEAFIYESANEKLTFDRGTEFGRVYYAAKEPVYQPATFDDAGYLRSVMSFVDTMTLEKGNFELTDIRERDGEDYRLFYFNERFEDELIFSNEVVVKMVENAGVTEARSIRYVPVGYEETVEEIYPVDEVLYNLINQIRQEDDAQIRISDIDIGYRLGPDSKKDFVSVVLEPYYRIKTGSGQTYYINAYTNRLNE